MKKALSVLWLTLCFGLGLTASLSSQTVFRIDENIDPMTGTGTFDNCGGIFLDSGGDQAYTANESYILTICPEDTASGNLISLTFEELELSENFTEEGDSLFFYNGLNTDAELIARFGPKQNLAPELTVRASETNVTGCITVRFISDGDRQGEGWRARVECVVPCQRINARLTNSNPMVTGGYIDACPGQAITFSGAGEYPENNDAYNQSDATSVFEWNFGDGTTGMGTTVEHRYERPGGYVVQLKITDTNGCTNSNFITQRVRISPQPDYQFANGLDSAVCIGDTIALALDTINEREAAFQSGAITPSDTVFIPDGDGTAVFDTIAIAQFSPGQRLESIDDLLSICANMEHSYLRDLEMKITCPSGESAILNEFVPNEIKVNFVGEPVQFDELSPAPGRGFDYCWTPNATGTWVGFTETAQSLDTLPPGDYESFEPLTNLVGCELNGIWRLEIVDNQINDNGFLFSWGINFNPDIFPVIETFTFTPQIVDYGWQTNAQTLSRTQDEIVAVANTAGNTSYTFSVQDDFGCTFDTTFTSVVLPPTHPDCIDCLEDLISSVDTTVCEGASVNIDATPENLPEDILFTFQESPARSFNRSPVPAGNTYRSTVAVNNVLPGVMNDPDQTIVSVCLNATINASAPYSIVLESPLGQRVTLVAEGTTGQFQNACFTPAATATINTATPPFTDDYLPVDPWTNLSGTNTNGEWRLLISSSTGVVDAGALGGWTMTLQGENNITFLWSPAEGLSCVDCAVPTATPNQTTTYSVEVSNSYGCVYQDSLTIIVDPNATSLNIDDILVDDVNCFGENTGEMEAVVSGGTGPGTYEFIWSDTLAQISSRAVFLPVGTYSVVVTDADGCIVRDSATVNQPDSLTLQIDPVDVACKGDATGRAIATPLGGTMPYRYQWDNGASTPEASDLAAGDYTLIVIDANDCQTSGAVTISEPVDELLVAIDQTAQGCAGEQGNELTVSVAGGTGSNYSFLWSNNTTTISIDNLDSIVYSVTVTDEAGCEKTASLKADDLDPIDFNFIHTKPTCQGLSDGQIGIDNIIGGTGTDPQDYSISWSTGATTEIITNLAGNQTYAATVTDAIGCFTEKSFELKQPTPISFEFNVDSTSCNGTADGAAEVINIQGEGGSITATFQWDANAGSLTTARAANLTAGDYQVTVTDEKGCEAVQTVTVDQPNPISTNVTSENNRCFQESSGAIAVQPTGGNGGYTFNWSTNEQTPNLDNLAAGSYVVTITDRKGCQFTETIIISEPEPVIIDLETQDPTCFRGRDGAITLIAAEGGTAPYQYSIDNDAFTSTNNFFGLRDGQYTVYIRDANDCLYTSQTELNEPLPLGIIPDKSRYTIQLGDSLVLGVTAQNAQGGVTFNWSAPYEGTLSCTDCVDPTANPENTITYQVSGVDSAGCRSTELVQVIVEKIRVVRVPTGFTPDGQGPNINNTLLVHGRPGTFVKLFQVYDRWGELVYENSDFEVNDATVGWDGNFRGQPMNAGTYIWYVEVEYIDGVRQAFKGETNLIR